jgi:flagellar protein FlaI
MKLKIWKRKEKKEESRSRIALALLRSKSEKRSWPKFFVTPVKKFLEIPQETKEITYPLLRPYAYANIKWDSTEGTMVYNVIEPVLDENERRVYDKLYEGLLQIIDVPLSAARNSGAVMKLLEEKIQWLIQEYEIELSDESYLKIMYHMWRNFAGLNEIEPLMHDVYIEDISCDGVNKHLYVVHHKFGSLRTNIMWTDIEALRNFVIKLAERCDRYISYAEPLVDGVLPNGSRIQATLAGDVTTSGPTFSIRKFPERPYTPIDMIDLGTANPEILAWLWFAIEHGANILISGGTATGKTSFLNSIAFFMSPEIKVVSIEDTREINIVHENWLPAVARPGFAGTHAGEVTMFDLLKESFRQNPDYLIVGEVRGEEAAVMFQAMSSGISCISTMHSGSVEDALKRLQTRPISLPPSLMESLDLIILMVHARERGPACRRIKEIDEIISVDPETNRVHSRTVFSWDAASDKFRSHKNSELLKKIAKEHGLSLEMIEKEIRQRAELLRWMAKQKMDWRDIANTFAAYYHDRPRVLAQMKAK